MNQKETRTVRALLATMAAALVLGGILGPRCTTTPCDEAELDALLAAQAHNTALACHYYESAARRCPEQYSVPAVCK